MFPAGHMPIAAAVQSLIPGPWGYVAAFFSHYVVDVAIGEAGYKNFKISVIAQIFWGLALTAILISTHHPELFIGAALGVLPDIFLILAKFKIIDYDKGVALHKKVHITRLEGVVKLTPKIQVVVHFALHFVLFGLLVK